MSVRRIPLGEATTAQLRSFAKDTLGFGLPFLSKEATLAKVQAAWDKDWIEVGDAAEPAAPRKAASVAEPLTAETVSDAPLTADEITRGNVAVHPSSGQPLEDPVLVRARLARDAKKVTVSIAKTDDKSVDDRVPLSVNGRMMLVERGKPQLLPLPYFHSLQNAIQYVYDDVEIDGQITRQRREVPLYPYSLVA